MPTKVTSYVVQCGICGELLNHENNKIGYTYFHDFDEAYTTSNDHGWLADLFGFESDYCPVCQEKSWNDQ